ncbi:hypothetical protein EJB05_50308, partial [Eragrostis curvula]
MPALERMWRPRRRSIFQSIDLQIVLDDDVALAVQEVVDRSSEENVKILEVDDGSEARRTSGVRMARRVPEAYLRPAKAELYLKVSPTPSALTDASARTLSSRFDDRSLASASEPCRRRTSWRAVGARGGADRRRVSGAGEGAPLLLQCAGAGSVEETKWGEQARWRSGRRRRG